MEVILYNGETISDVIQIYSSGPYKMVLVLSDDSDMLIDADDIDFINK